VFELKRGALTRDAVAQVLDYASDLAEKGEEHLARLIETNSGRDGIPVIEDFVDWYGQQYPDSDGPLAQRPRMILVGLGVDDRARRVTSFLAQHSVDIQLLTFHAFRSGDRLMMARLVESDGPKPSATSPAASKDGNRRALHEAAAQFGVEELLDDVASFVATRLPGAYQWPGKTSYSFSLQELTDAGRPTLRAYITIYVDSKKKGALLFNITPRAARAGGDAVSALVQSIGAQHTRSPGSQYVEHEFRVTSTLWATHKPAFDAALAGIYAGWQRNATAENASPGEPLVQAT
jgi:hypothetical protein